MEDLLDVGLHDSVKPLQHILKLFGITPFSFLKQNNRRYELLRDRLLDISLLFMWSGVVLSMMCFNIYTAVYSPSDIPEKIKVTFIFNNISILSTNIIILITSVCYSKVNIIKMFTKMKNVDKIIETRSRIRIYRKTKLSVLKHIITMFIFLLLSYSGNYYIYYNGELLSILKASVNNLSYTVNIVMVLQYVTLVRMLELRYKYMNNRIMEYSENEDSAAAMVHNTHNHYSHVNILCDKTYCSSTLAYPHAKSETHRIYTLRQAYIELYDTVNIINSHFGIQILSEIISLVIVCVAAFYYGLYIFGNANTDTGDFTLYFKACLLTFWTFIYAILFAWLIVCCHHTTQEGNRGPICIQRITAQYNIKYGILLKLKTLSNQMKDMKVEFTACGFFVLNFPLLGTVMGGIFTYILIMVQLE